MQFPSLYLAITALLLTSSITAVSARPMPCNEKVLDMILNGDLPKSACCSYGVCMGDVNVSGG